MKADALSWQNWSGVLSWQCWRWTKTEEIFSGWLKQIQEKRYINWQNWSWQMKYLLGFYYNISVLNEDRGNTFWLIKTNPQKSYISWQNWSRGARLAITLQWKRLLWLVWVGTNGGVVMSPLNRERTRLLSRFLRNKEKCVGHWLFEYISLENQEHHGIRSKQR